jgi:hypothetical protein
MNCFGQSGIFKRTMDQMLFVTDFNWAPLELTEMYYSFVVSYLLGRILPSSMSRSGRVFYE